MPEASVLLVEDDFLIRACLAEFLVDAGLNVHEADSRAEALLHLDSTGPVSILISDISLPDGDGLAVGRHARAHQPDIPIIYISGYGTPPDQGPDALTRFIAKPYAMSDVLDAITALTRDTAPRQ